MSAASPVSLTKTRSDDSPSALAADGLSFSYGAREALSNVSFAIARGEVFGFLGPNGGGKTTLFKLLSTLVTLQSGRASVLGRDLAGDTKGIRRKMGVVFQHPSVDGKLTVLENLQHHGRLYGITGTKLKERATAMLDSLGLTARSRDLVETLSGGTRRRVELAKAMLHQPELLLLDEPSTGLDPMARREFFGHLEQLSRRDSVTVVLTTHHMEEAERCDRIAMLHQGQLVACAAPSELKSRVGGDVVVIHTAAPELLRRKLLQQLKLKSAIVDGTLRIERPRGHELIRELVDTLGAEIESVSFGKPTLEDVFVHLTGHKFDLSGEAPNE